MFGIRQFSKAHPERASNMGLSAESITDPQMVMLFDAVAHSNARIETLLDDQYAKLTAPLLEMTFPQLVRPLPAASIAHVDAGAATPAGITSIPRGTQMTTTGNGALAYKYRTAYDIQVTPLVLTRARFDPAGGDGAHALPHDADAVVSIDIDGASSPLGLRQPGMRSLRIYINGDAALSAAIRDALLMRTVCAYVEYENSGDWLPLAGSPIAPVGYAVDDALLPVVAAEHPAHRLLLAFFAYPECFNFFDLDMAALLAHDNIGCKRLTLQLALRDTRADSTAARLLKNLSHANLLLGCSPVVNLFKQAAQAITLNHTRSDYPLLPSSQPPSAFDIYSVDSVHLMRTAAIGPSSTEFVPFHCLRDDVPGGRGQHWLLRRDAAMAAASPGHEHTLAFVDRAFKPMENGAGTVSVDLTCTNGDLPSAQRYGQPAGDLSAQDIPVAYPVRLLRKPTPGRRLGTEEGSHWRLVASLTLNHRALTDASLEPLRALLRLYAPQDSAPAQRQIDGITSIAHKAQSRWLTDANAAVFATGVEVTVTLDEAAYADCGVHAFASLLDHFFGQYVHMDSFTCLTVLSASSGKELLRCPPRNGALSLV